MAQKLDARQRKFVELRAKGVPRRESAIMAGYSDTEKSGDHVESGEKVAAELARLRQEAAVNAGVTKEDVVRGLVDAAQLAKQVGELPSMVAAYRELGRMLGFYAPEVKKIEKGINKGDLKRALEDLTDDELRELAHGRVIDGISRRVPDAEDAETVPQLQEKRA
jgi:phage terminase small subunit